MISNPEHGWCDFVLGDFYGTPSYITNVPVDLLQAFSDAIHNGCGMAWFNLTRLKNSPTSKVAG